MTRYSVIQNKTKREIVLLKGKPCRWGRCSFCDYINDNSTDEEEINRINEKVISQITGEFAVLEVINSGNIFELPQMTLDLIKRVINEKSIHTLFFEAHWIYRNRLQEMRDFFGVHSKVKTGVESFDRDFRELVLTKGAPFGSVEEVKSHFDSVCIMVGIKGQTREMIARDVQIAQDNFDHFTVNVFVENSTSIKPDPDLIEWFQKEFAYLDELQKCDVLWVNTDFGVGE